MSMESIREHYKVPAKRGMIVRSAFEPDTLAQIISADKERMLLKIRASTNRWTYICHPLELDYLVGDEWILGETLSTEYEKRVKRHHVNLGNGLVRIDKFVDGIEITNRTD